VIKLKKLIIILLVILIPISILVVIDNYFSERSRIYVEKEVITVISNSLTISLEKPIQDSLFSSPMLLYQYDKNEVIKGIYIDSNVVNQILINVNQSLKEALDKGVLEKEITNIEIPLGSLISKSVFANVGPNVPIKILPISFYKTDIVTNMKPYGINNVLFEVYLNIKIEVDTIIPLRKDEINFSTNILLVSQLLQGEVPYYYYSGDGTIEALPH
jgi:hypothetical protein